MSSSLKVNANLNIQNPALLFQFLFTEFMEVFEETQQIEQLYQEMELTLIKHRLLTETGPLCASLMQHLTNLVGTGTVSHSFYPWVENSGSLTKLNQYCSLFSKASQKHLRSIKNMNHCASQAFHAALQCLENLGNVDYESAPRSRLADFAPLYRLLDDLIDNVRRFSRLLLQILVHQLNDENILLFVLRKRREIEILYKTNVLTKILRKKFPEGFEAAKQYVQNCYSKRGFHELAEHIADQFAEVDAP